MNVKLIRMHSGEDVVADLISEDSHHLKISNPIVLVPGRDGTVGFAPWSPVISPDVKEIIINGSAIVGNEIPFEILTDINNVVVIMG